MTTPNTIIADLVLQVEILSKQRDELLDAIRVIEIKSEECLDFNECTAMLISIDDYHRLTEAADRVKGITS